MDHRLGEGEPGEVSQVHLARAVNFETTSFCDVSKLYPVVCKESEGVSTPPFFGWFKIIS